MGQPGFTSELANFLSSLRMKQFSLQAPEVARWQLLYCFGRNICQYIFRTLRLLKMQAKQTLMLYELIERF